MASTGQGHGDEAAEDALAEPSRVVTMFWILITGTAVVAVVLVFLQLFTNLLR